MDLNMAQNHSALHVRMHWNALFFQNQCMGSTTVELGFELSCITNESLDYDTMYNFLNENS